jgi:hypothetical protein
MGHGKAIIALAASVGLLWSSGAGVSGLRTQVNALELTGTDNTAEMIGEGSMEGNINMGLMKVVLPVVDISFIADPQGLIKSTNAAKYPGAVFDYKLNGQTKDDGFVFFKKTSGTKTYYSSVLDLDFKNKSSYPVNVKVSAEYVAGNSNVALSAPQNYGSSPQISFMLDDEQSEPVSIDSLSESNEFECTLNGIPQAYCVTYNSAKCMYEYELDSKKLSSVKLPEYKIQLIGQCNSDADWSNSDVSESTLKIIWYVSRDESVQMLNPSVKNLQVTVDSKRNTGVVLTLDYAGSSASVSSVSCISGGKETALSISQYSASGNTLNISADAFKNMAAGSYIYKVVFGNGTADTVQIDVK